MHPLAKIKSILNIISFSQWPGELAQPDHILWQMSKWLFENSSESNLSDIKSEIEKITAPTDSIGASGYKLFSANLELIKGLAWPSKQKEFFTKAAGLYAEILKEFGPSEEIFLWGQQIVENTLEDLKIQNPDEFLAKTYLVVVGRVRSLAIPIFAKVLPVKNSKPCCIFDPKSIGIVDLNIENADKDFMQLSLLPAWKYYLNQYGQDAKTIVWGFGHPASGTKKAVRIPSSEIIHLEGASAGGAFAIAFQSAHQGLALDPEIAISVQISETKGTFKLLQVDDLDLKTKVDGIHTILTS